uniref:Uncharacterized protein n=1 Tax=Mustela putorius furo TaxID=9669 RepID=M3YGN7_MUSPF
MTEASSHVDSHRAGAQPKSAQEKLCSVHAAQMCPVRSRQRREVGARTARRGKAAAPPPFEHRAQLGDELPRNKSKGRVR